MDRCELLSLAYKRDESLHVGNPEYVQWLRRFTLDAVNEDIRSAGDITTRSVLRHNTRRLAHIIAKADGILAGVEEALWFYEQYGIRAAAKRKDGDVIKSGDIILELTGDEFELLETERTGLNLLQRMSGIASVTRSLVDFCRPLLVAATRKTHWGSLDNKAVSVGGGATHRLGLWESILIKENHLEALSREGGFDVIEESLHRAWDNRDKAIFIEIEVENREQALRASRCFISLMEQANQLKPCIVMLDNFAPDEAARTIEDLKHNDVYPRVLVEASGGITPGNIGEYRDAGVDVASMGYLTHSPKALDISQLIVRDGL